MAITALAGGTVTIGAGVICWRGRLPRNQWAGIRTSASMRSEAAFRAANRAGGPVIAYGGAAGVLGGLAALLARSEGRGGVGSWCALVGDGLLVLLVIAGGIIGHRVADGHDDHDAR
jgi:hypothetical protein